jgi:hypothetical protein
MANIPPGFNSDEFAPDEDEETLNPFLDVGQKTMVEMRSFAVEDCFTSKRRVKNPRDLSGSFDQARSRHLWFNYFQTFVVDILGQE